MKILTGFILFLLSFSAYSQDAIQTQQPEVDVKEYMLYQKNMYIDYMPKDKIPAGLKKNFYSDLTSANFTQDIGQYLDTENKVHNLYLRTTKAGEGFLTINRGALSRVPVDKISEMVYVVNSDTVTTFQQMTDLVTLPENKLKSADYRLSPSGKLIIDVKLK